MRMRRKKIADQKKDRIRKWRQANWEFYEPCPKCLACGDDSKWFKSPKALEYHINQQHKEEAEESGNEKANKSVDESNSKKSKNGKNRKKKGSRKA